MRSPLYSEGGPYLEEPSTDMPVGKPLGHGSRAFVKWVVTSLLWLAYVLTFAALVPYTQVATASTVLVPVALSSWLWGLRGGALIALLSGVLNIALYETFGVAVEHWWMHLAPALVVLGIGAVVGHLRDLRGALKRQHERISYQADHDLLTGLLNRASLTRGLSALLGDLPPDGGGLSVLFIDLDRFKLVNDTLGHAAGDALLVAVARRLERHTRAGDLLARLSGDEFVVVFGGLGDARGAVAAARKLLAALEVPHDLGEAVTVHASIGVSLYPAHGLSVEALLSRADNAMYRVKGGGKNDVRLYRGDGEPAWRSRLAQDLPAALEQSGLSLTFRPRVALPSRRTVGAEASVGWQHPEFGIVPSAVLRGFAQELGLSAALEGWVLRSACRAAAAWDDLLELSVAVSSALLLRPGFVGEVSGVLEASGLARGRLALELTEADLLRDPEAVAARLRALGEVGVRVALRDFGIGAASFGLLRRLEVATLKLDPCLIGDPAARPDSGEAAVVRALVVLGHALGKTVVAEGVETPAQLDLLTAAGCDHAQGRLFAQPVAAEAALARDAALTEA